MKYINRAILKELSNKLLPNKVLILLGARRVGKTELINKFLENYNGNYLELNGEDNRDTALLEDRSVNNYKRLLLGVDLLVIDEAQNIKEIGVKLKLIVDTIKNIKVIATGSSIFDLNNKLGEPLVGRKNTIHLFPIAQMEFSLQENYKITQEKLEDRLIFGSYPEIEKYKSKYEKIEYLNEMVNSYLLKDILIFDGIKQSDKILSLLRLIAFQIGKEVSLSELGNQLGISKNTVDKYLDLLSKVFIIYKIKAFSRNHRKEISKSSRWYFYDNGIRNAIINNFNTINLRNDIGELWENYIITERVKYQSYNKIISNNYFWRTYDQQEIDWIEEINGQLEAYEFKWNPRKKQKKPSGFLRAYPNTPFKIINNNNYLDWITN